MLFVFTTAMCFRTGRYIITESKRRSRRCDRPRAQIYLADHFRDVRRVLKIFLDYSRRIGWTTRTVAAAISECFVRACAYPDEQTDDFSLSISSLLDFFFSSWFFWTCANSVRRRLRCLVSILESHCFRFRGISSSGFAAMSR